MSSNAVEYAMEVTAKTAADIKGGTLVKIDGRCMHLEMPQVPIEHVHEFASMTKFKLFNTNNIWVNLNAVQRQLASMRMEIIVNPKQLASGEAVLQLETSIGGAIRNFDRAYCIHVPRRRFLPVKKTQDMLAVMSNAYELGEDFVLRLHRSRAVAPMVSLSSNYDDVKAFHARFKHIPDMLNLDALTVIGDVWFGARVVLKGTVEIRAKSGESLHVPDGALIHDRRILDGAM